MRQLTAAQRRIILLGLFIEAVMLAFAFFGSGVPGFTTIFGTRWDLSSYRYIPSGRLFWLSVMIGVITGGLVILANHQQRPQQQS